MGKQRMTELLTQLRENQAKDAENAAAIYTVAQVAVNALAESDPDAVEVSRQLPAAAIVSKAELLEQYGSFNNCRRAAKEKGIRFSKTPSWKALEAAFGHQKIFSALVQDYLAANPNQHLKGVTFEISPDD